MTAAHRYLMQALLAVVRTRVAADEVGIFASYIAEAIDLVEHTDYRDAAELRAVRLLESSGWTVSRA